MYIKATQRKAVVRKESWRHHPCATLHSHKYSNHKIYSLPVHLFYQIAKVDGRDRTEDVSRFSVSWMLPGRSTTLLLGQEKAHLWQAYLHPKHLLLNAIPENSDHIFVHPCTPPPHIHQAPSPKRHLPVVRMWLSFLTCMMPLQLHQPYDLFLVPKF